MSTGTEPSPAQQLREAIEAGGFTVVQGIEDDLTREQVLELAEGLLEQMRTVQR